MVSRLLHEGKTTLKKLSWLLSLLLLSGCASTAEKFEKAFYHDAAFDDKNRAPASMSPPSQENVTATTVDKMHVRTQADYYFAMGESLSYEGHHQKAIESFKMVLIYDPDAPKVHLRLSTEYIKIGLFTKAIEHAELAINKNPQYTESRLLLGGLYSSMKAYDKAISQYEEILKTKPKNAEALLYLGAVQAELKNYDKSVKYFESLSRLEEYPTPHLPYYYIGRVRSEQEGMQYKKAAEQAYKKALQLKPDHIESVVGLGNLYTKMGQKEEAIATYRKFQKEHGPSIRIAEILAQNYIENEQLDLAYDQLEIIENNSEDSLNVKVKMALILIEKKNYKVAVQKLLEVLAQAPESDKIRFYLGAVYEEIGQWKKAVEQFQKIQPESQLFGEAIVHSAYLLKQQKKTDDAIKIVKNALESRPDVAQLYAIYASLLDDKAEYKTALEVLNKGVNKFPNHVHLHFLIGTIHDKLGDKKAVVELMKKVIEMDPNHVQGLNYLAYTYSELNEKLEEAEKLVKRALALEPNDGFILDTYGWILFKSGRTQEAIKTLETAHKHQPNEGVIAEHLGDAYLKAQLPERAKQMYLKAVQNEVDESKIKLIKSKIFAIENQIMQKENRAPASTASPASKPAK